MGLNESLILTSQSTEEGEREEEHMSQVSTLITKPSQATCHLQG